MSKEIWSFCKVTSQSAYRNECTDEPDVGSSTQIEYYDRMSAIRETGDYEQWIKFFPEGIYISGKSAIETANKLIDLRTKNQSATLYKKNIGNSDEIVLILGITSYDRDRKDGNSPFYFV